MNIAEKLEIIATNQQAVYNAGYEKGKEVGGSGAPDPDKIIEATAEDINALFLDDVSEFEHDIKIKVSSKNLANKKEFVQYGSVRKYLDIYLEPGEYYYSSNMHAASGVTFYTAINMPETLDSVESNRVQMFSNFSSTIDEGQFVIEQAGTYRFLIYCSDSEVIFPALEAAWNNIWIQIEKRNFKTDYTPYIPKEPSKNLLPYPYIDTTKTINGVTFTVNNDGTITLNGTATDTATFWLRQSPTKTILPVGGKATVSEGESSIEGAFVYINYYDNTGTVKEGSFNTAYSVSSTKEIPDTWVGDSIFLRATKGYSFDNVIVKPQIELGEIATAYEPYYVDSFEEPIFIGGKNLFNINQTPKYSRFTTILEQTDNSITVRNEANKGTKWTQVAFALDESLAGKEITLSGSWEMSNPNSQGALRIQWCNSSGAGISSMMNYTDVSGKPSTATIIPKPPGASYLGLLVYSVADSANSSSGDTIKYSNIQIELGGGMTSYSPYQEIETQVGYDITTKSKYPAISIWCAINGMQIESEYQKSWGKYQAWNEQWDAYQSNGYRTDYGRAFAGAGWTDKSFSKVKYDIVPTGGSGTSLMFSQSLIFNLKEILEKSGRKLDFSKATAISQVFDNCQVTHVGVIDMRSATSVSLALMSATNLKYVEKLIFKSDGSQSINATQTFSSCNKLEHMIVEGVIGYGTSLKWSTLLDRESIESIVNALSTSVTGQTLTLSLTAVKKAFETSEGANDGNTSEAWTTLITTKSNWTITLA